MEKLIEPVKWESTDTLEFEGGATKERLKQGEAFGRKFAEKISRLGED